MDGDNQHIWDPFGADGINDYPIRKFFVTDDEKYVLTINDAKESKTITAEFLLSYILPLFAFDFTQWDEVVKFFDLLPHFWLFMHST